MPKYTEHPSVPKVLQEALKDYPELIADLQSSLNRGGMWPGITRAERTDELEAAMWRLEGDLSHYIALAAEEVKAAEASGDAESIAKATEKETLMRSCRGKKLHHGFDELAEFFRWGKD